MTYIVSDKYECCELISGGDRRRQLTVRLFRLLFFGEKVTRTLLSLLVVAVMALLAGGELLASDCEDACDENCDGNCLCLRCGQSPYTLVVSSADNALRHGIPSPSLSRLSQTHAQEWFDAIDHPPRNAA